MRFTPLAPLSAQLGNFAILTIGQPLPLLSLPALSHLLQMKLPIKH